MLRNNNSVSVTILPSAPSATALSDRHRMDSFFNRPRMKCRASSALREIPSQTRVLSVGDRAMNSASDRTGRELESVPDTSNVSTLVSCSMSSKSANWTRVNLEQCATMVFTCDALRKCFRTRKHTRSMEAPDTSTNEMVSRPMSCCCCTHSIKLAVSSPSMCDPRTKAASGFPARRCRGLWLW